MNFDGAFGSKPGSESHAGLIYCCVGLLSITGIQHVQSLLHKLTPSHRNVFSFKEPRFLRETGGFLSGEKSFIEMFSRTSTSDRCRSLGMVVMRETTAFWWFKRQAGKIAGRVLLLVGFVGVDDFGPSSLDR